MLPRIRSTKGQTLILAYMAIFVLVIATGSLLAKALSDKNIAERERLITEALYLAEGATEKALHDFTSGIANFSLSAGVSTYSSTAVYATFSGASVTTDITSLQSSDTVITDSLGRNVYMRLYEAVSTATHPENSSIQVTVHQVFSRRLIPTFQHMIFYEDDLEVLPGANMTLTGRIHCNNDIYVNSRADLTIDSTQFHSAGSIYNARKDDPSDPMGGDVDIRVTQAGPPVYAEMDGLDCNDANWATEAITRWNGTVKSAVHGVNSLTAPSVGTTAPGGYYANQANVVITNEGIVKNGVLLTEGTDYPTDTVTTTTTDFYNNREGKYITMTTIDMAKLAGLAGSCGGSTCPNNLPGNGLLYATRTDTSGPEQPGIRVINGSEISNPAGSGGLTVVTDAPAYVQGNYNTVNEKPTSIIADSVNLLSGNWLDANSALGLSSRPATSTVYNCAFVSGIDTTTLGSYNGGLENYPRMHEDWSDDTMTIKGSFVQLWDSSVATGAWQYDDPQYTAPTRAWSYNANFNDPSQLPPFTPKAVEAERLAWWYEIG